MAAVAVIGFRICFCAQPPTHTSDALRNLGYTHHFWSHGPALYLTKAAHFHPEGWAYQWPDTGYIYPPVTLLFFAFLSGLGAGVAWVKILLTACDVVSSVILARQSSRWLGLILFATPSLVWWTSHEGQFESLHLLMMMACLHVAMRRRWLCAGVFLALGIQTKLFSVLLIPFLLAEMFSYRAHTPAALYRAAVGFALGFLPFLPFYFYEPRILLLPMMQKTGNFNSFGWSGLGANAVFSLLSLSILTGLMIRFGSSARRALAASAGTGFWLIVKSLRWALPWYSVQLPGLLFPLVKERRAFLLLLALNFFQDYEAATLIVGSQRGYISPPRVVEQMRICLWTCDYEHVQKP